MILLCLDLSTSSSGYSVFINGELTRFGALTPKVKGLSKMHYPMSSFRKILSICVGLRKLLTETNPDLIYVEEVNRGIQRISQKSLDALHFFFYLDLVQQKQVDRLRYIDSDGKTGWRKILDLRLTEAQKKENKKRKKGKKITKKHLAAAYVNTALGFDFDVDKDATANDICDSIGMGLAIFKAGLLDFEFGEKSCLSKSKSTLSGPKRKSKRKARSTVR